MARTTPQGTAARLQASQHHDAPHAYTCTPATPAAIQTHLMGSPAARPAEESGARDLLVDLLGLDQRRGSAQAASSH